jgi:hypothetical protein
MRTYSKSIPPAAWNMCHLCNSYILIGRNRSNRSHTSSGTYSSLFAPLGFAVFSSPRSCVVVRPDDLAKSSNYCSYVVSGIVALYVPSWVGIASSPQIWASVRLVSFLNSDTCWPNVQSTLRSGIDYFDWVPSCGISDEVFFFPRWVLSTCRS